MNPTVRTWIRRTLIVLLALEAIYLIAGNAFLNAAAGRELINRAPQKFQIQWDSGWTVLPGFAQVHNLRLSTQTRSVQWYVQVDRASGHLFLAPLLRRHLSLSRASVEGVDFRLRRRLDFVSELEQPAAEQPAEQPESKRQPAAGVEAPRQGVVTIGGTDLTPQIPGFANPPEGVAKEINQSRRHRRGWILDLSNITADKIREVWIEKAHYVAGEGGAGQLHGNLRSQLGGSLEMRNTQLTLSGGELLVGDKAIARAIELAVDARFHRYLPSENRGTQALRFLSGTLDLDAQLSGANPIDFFFRSARWVSIGADGPLSSRLVLDHGTLIDGTTLQIGPGNIAVRYLEYQSEGFGTVVGGVESHGQRSTSWVEATLEEFRIRREGLTEPHIRGQGFRLAAHTGDLNLANRRPNVDIEVVLPKSEIVDLRYYNAFLPAESGFSFSHGRGTIQAELKASTGNSSGHGSVDLQAAAVEARFQEIPVHGDIEIRGRFPSIDIENRRFSLAGSELRLDHVTLAGGEQTRDWWLRLEMPKGEAHFSQPLNLDTELRAKLRDSRPLLALLAAKNPVVRWIDGLLAVENVAAQGGLRISPSSIYLREAQLTGDNLEVLADLDLRRNRREGVFFLRRGHLSAAVELDHGERDWKLTGSRKWYLQRLAARHAAKSP